MIMEDGMCLEVDASVLLYDCRYVPSLKCNKRKSGDVVRSPAEKMVLGSAVGGGSSDGIVTTKLKIESKSEGCLCVVYCYVLTKEMDGWNA